MNDSAKQLKELKTSVASSAAIQSVDLLTDREIEMLRKLRAVAGTSEADSYIAEISADDSLRGMYVQLSELGFVHGTEYLGGGLGFHGTSAKAGWAVRRHDIAVEREQAASEELRRQRRHDRLFSIATLILGWLLGLLSTPIASFVGSLGQCQ